MGLGRGAELRVRARRRAGGHALGTSPRRLCTMALDKHFSQGCSGRACAGFEAGPGAWQQAGDSRDAADWLLQLGLWQQLPLLTNAQLQQPICYITAAPLRCA